MADASIPLSVRPPVIESPLDAQTRALNLTQLAQGVQINDAKLKEERLKAQAADEDRRDFETMRQAYGQNPGDMEAVRKSIAPKVNPRNLQAFDKSAQEHAVAMAKIDTDKLSLQRDTAEQLARHIQAVAAVRPGDTSPEAQQARAAEWAKQAVLAKAKGYDPQNAINPAAYPGDDQLPVLDVQLRGSAKHLADEEARRKMQMEAVDEQHKKAQEARAEALAPYQVSEAQSKAEIAGRQAAAGVLATAVDADTYAAHYNNLRPEVAKFFPKPDKFDPATTPDIVRQLGQTAEQQITSTERAEQHRQSESIRQDTNDVRREGLDLRRDLADQTAALRRELAGNKTTGERKLTPGQINTQERNISALENGNASRPGLNDLRIKYGSQLKANMDDQPNRDDKSKIGNVLFDEKGKLTPAGQSVTDKLTAATRNLQQQQYRKADLYGVGKPDASEVDSAPDGGEVEAADGSVWKKSGGVAFFSRMGGAAEPAAKPAAAPKAAPAQPEIPVGKRFKNSAGVIIKWDGKQFVDDKTGKPYKQ